MLSAVTNPQKEEGAFVVRRRLSSSRFCLVARLWAPSATALASVLLAVSIACVSASLLAWLQVIGASFLLWGTLFIRGLEIQDVWFESLSPSASNQWIYRTLYCVGTAVLSVLLRGPHANATKQPSISDVQKAPT